MTTLAGPVSADELELRFRAADDVVERAHDQVIWLLAKGRTVGEAAEVVAMSERWVSKLAARYEREGADGLGDRRRRNRGARPLLSAEDLEALRERLREDDGGTWSGPKVARWIAARLGLEHVHAPRGWEALKKLRWSIQSPRPRNPRAAGAEEEAAFKKSWPGSSRRRPNAIPANRSRSGRPMSIASGSNRFCAASGHRGGSARWS